MLCWRAGMLPWKPGKYLLPFCLCGFFFLLLLCSCLWIIPPPELCSSTSAWLLTAHGCFSAAAHCYPADMPPLPPKGPMTVNHPGQPLMSPWSQTIDRKRRTSVFEYCCHLVATARNYREVNQDKWVYILNTFNVWTSLCEICQNLKTLVGLRWLSRNKRLFLQPHTQFPEQRFVLHMSWGITPPVCELMLKRIKSITLTTWHASLEGQISVNMVVVVLAPSRGRCRTVLEPFSSSHVHVCVELWDRGRTKAMGWRSSPRAPPGVALHTLLRCWFRSSSPLFSGGAGRNLRPPVPPSRSEGSAPTCTECLILRPLDICLMSVFSLRPNVVRCLLGSSFPPASPLNLNELLLFCGGAASTCAEVKGHAEGRLPPGK